MIPPQNNKSSSARSAVCLRLLAILAVVFVSSAIALHAEQPIWWWTYWGAVNSNQQNDNAAANEGQLKQFTVQAVNEMNTDLPGYGAGAILTGTVNYWINQYEALGYTSANLMPSDFQVINVGQLKAIGYLVWSQLQAAGYTGAAGVPAWLVVNPANDHHAANLGQLKTVFNFDLTYSTKVAGLPDWWVNSYASGQNITASSSVPWSNGTLTYQQAYQQGINPSGTPILTIVSGNHQHGSAGNLLPAPLVVSLADSSGNPVPGIPVQFAAIDQGTLQASAMSTPGNPITVLTGQNAQASIYFTLPSGNNATRLVGATVGSGASEASLPSAFSESSDNGFGTYASPFAPSNVSVVLNSDGSLDVSWQNNTDSLASIPISIMQHNGNWLNVANVQAGTTSVHIPAP